RLAPAQPPAASASSAMVVRVVAVRFTLPSNGNFELLELPPDGGLFRFRLAAVGGVVVHLGPKGLDQVKRIALAQAQRRPERAESELKGGAVMAAMAMPESFGFGDAVDFHGFLSSAVGKSPGLLPC